MVRVCELFAVIGDSGILLSRAVRDGVDVCYQRHSEQWTTSIQHVLRFEIDAGSECNDCNLCRHFFDGESRVFVFGSDSAAVNVDGDLFVKLVFARKADVVAFESGTLFQADSATNGMVQ